MLKYEDERLRRAKRLESAFSLRESLFKQGCNKEGVKLHMAFISETLMVNPHLDIERYRVDPANPNAMPTMG